MKRHLIPRRAIPLAAIALVLAGTLAAFAHGDDGKGAIRVLSSPPDLVSGGEALVQVEVPHHSFASDVRVTLNGQDITGEFKGSQTSRTLLGLVTGLVLGENRLAVLTKENHWRPSATLDITNHPITGPSFSFPHQTPFICQTQSYVLPVTGANLGPPLDADCSVATRVDYVYMSTGGTLKPLPNPTVHPADLAQTTNSDGRTVNFILRTETGTINRSIYRIAVLHDPVTDPAPDPWHPPAGWNHRLLYIFGSGCSPGYHQGNPGNGEPLNNGTIGNLGLAAGYAVIGSSLNAFATNCDDVTSGETMMMVKSHFIETFGVPDFTIGNGASGGSMQQHLIAANYPGLLQGILPGRSFPDIITFDSAYVDCDLLVHYFNGAGLTWTPAQTKAVVGHIEGTLWCGSQTFVNLIRPKVCDASIPPADVYNPVTNPTGTRCTLYDDEVNVFGHSPGTGFAPRPLDNVGVQYGLQALNAGTISFDQFIDLNTHVGGYDIDGNYVASRSVGDRTALRTAYRTGRINNGKVLGDLPIIDIRPYTDMQINSAVLFLHDAVRSLVMRARLIQANGNADNQVIITVDPGLSFTTYYFGRVLEMDQWIRNIANDHRPGSVARKVARNKPAGLVDACYDATGAKVTDTATCLQLYPYGSEPRLVAGEPLTNDRLKCALKPVDPRDYAQALTASQLAQLRAAFPQGVCDYRRPGVGQQPQAATWLSYPSPGEFDLTSESERGDRDKH